LHFKTPEFNNFFERLQKLFNYRECEKVDILDYYLKPDNYYHHA